MDLKVVIRDETDADAGAITEVTVAAFKTLEISNHTEQFIIAALRRAKALTLSLVAEANDRVIGHIAFSPLTISDGTRNWYGLGPVSVLPGKAKGGHPIKGCPSRAKRSLCKKKRFFKPCRFQSSASLPLPLFHSCFDVSLCCTSHPSGSRLLATLRRFNSPFRISRTRKPSVPGRVQLVVSGLVVVNQPLGGSRRGQ